MTVLLGLMLTLVLCLTGCGLFEKDEGSTVVMSLGDYYNVPDGEAMIIIDETVYEKNALWSDNMAYIDLDTVTEMFSHRFFAVPAENMLIYTSPDEIFDFTPGSCDYFLNREMYTSNVPIVQKKGDMFYIAVGFLEQCGITYSMFDDPARVLITYSKDAYLCMNAKEDTPIRAGKELESDRLREVKAGERLRIIDGGGIRENGFIKVQSSDGVRGYCLQDDLDESYYADPVFTDFTPKEYTHITSDSNIYLGWELMYTSDNLGYLKDHLANAPELTTVAPTWFFLSGTDGELTSYANSDYVDYAHEKGVDVWATFKNDTIEGQFTCTEDSHTVLSSTEKRRALIDSILAVTAQYGLDGINIDFEMLKLDSGVYFVEFLRELSVYCRAQGIVLSVDNYVPEAYNAYYDIKEQGEILDYVVIMGYDQHYAGSENAGSVSSLDWYTTAIENTVAMADPARVIMGVPFYTRVWREEGAALYVDSTPVLRDIPDTVKGQELIWKETAGQYYAEWSKSGKIYKVWVEDNESLKRKANAARAAGLKGIAAWKLGDEPAGTWEMIVDYMENDHSQECEQKPAEE